MKNTSIVIVMLGLLYSVPLVARESHEHKSERSCKQEHCCTPTPISCPTVIKKSGCYCLTKDIRGTIEITADNVSLDLNCHQIDAHKKTGIKASGVQSLSIYNGTIVNAQVGISGNNLESPQITSLRFTHVNRAIVVDESSKLDFSQIDIQNCTNKSISLLNIHACSDVNLTQINICKNVHQVIDEDDFGTSSGLFTITNSDNVNLVQCKTNNNTQAVKGFFSPLLISECSNVTIEGHESNGNTLTKTEYQPIVNLRPDLTGIYAVRSSNVVVKNSISNYNLTTHDPQSPTSGTLYVLCLLQCQDCIIENCETNNNATQHGYIVGIAPFECTGVVVKDCQSNNNGLITSYVTIGIYVRDTGKPFDIRTQSDAAIVDNCQCNGNIADSAAGGIAAVQSTIIKDCQTNSSYSIGTPGFLFDEAGGSFGIVVVPWGAEALPSDSCTIERCEANSTRSEKGFSVAYWLSEYPTSDNSTSNFTSAVNVRMTNCTAVGTYSRDESAIGIYQSNSRNNVIENCQIYYTKSDSSKPDSVAAGILFNGNIFNTDEEVLVEDIAIQNCQVFETETTGDASAIGILIKNAKRGKISDCQVEKTFSSGAGEGNGIVLGDNVGDYIVQDSTSTGNQTYGFVNIEQNSNSFFGNESDNNGTNYAGEIPAGNIVIYDQSTGIFNPTPPNRWSNLSIS